MDDEQFILYVYERVEDKPVAHAYGPLTQEEGAKRGRELAENHDGEALGFQVLPLEPVPTEVSE